MNRRTPLAVFVALLAIAAAPGAASKHGTTESKNYTSEALLNANGPGVNGQPIVNLQNGFINSCPSPEGIGGVRFCNVENPPPRTVTITVRDAVPVRTGTRVFFVDAQGANIGDERFCSSPQRPVTLTVPPGTSQVHVTVNLASSVLIGGCVPTPGTAGTITVAWSAL